MSIEHINPDTVAQPKPPFSNVVVAGDYCFISGQAALDRDTGELMIHGSFESEADLVFENVINCLNSVGLTVNDVVKVNAYLNNINLIKEYNEIYRKYFPEPYPARTSIGCLMGDIRLEVDCIAYLKNKK